MCTHVCIQKQSVSMCVYPGAGLCVPVCVCVRVCLPERVCICVCVRVFA